MAISKDDILEYISGLSVLELSELINEFEEKFGVTANPVEIEATNNSEEVSINFQDEKNDLSEDKVKIADE